MEEGGQLDVIRNVCVRDSKALSQNRGDENGEGQAVVCGLGDKRSGTLELNLMMKIFAKAGQRRVQPSRVMVQGEEPS